jgi:pyridoxal 5'-phosphate synthase pdxT subunit
MNYDGLKIGIVAIQGDYEAHAKVLERLGVSYTFVRTPADLAELAGVILPGGESTTHLKVMAEEGLFDALKKFAAADGAFFGTCAGMILLAKEVHGPAQASLGLLDVSVLRNGYGRQLASDVHMGQTKLRAQPLEMVFIRAPIIESVGAGVEVLAEDAGHPVLVREGKILAATFHPELSDDTAVHEYFVRMARSGCFAVGVRGSNGGPAKRERRSIALTLLINSKCTAVSGCLQRLYENWPCPI